MVFLELNKEYKIPLSINRLKGALTLYFSDHTVKDFDGAQAASTERFAEFFKLMLEQGINLAPSKYEAWFITTEHTVKDIEETLNAVEYAFSKMV